MITLGLLLIISAGLVTAREIQDEGPPADPATVNEVVNLNIPVQGRLTNSDGYPINGDYNVAFRVYDKKT